MAIVIVREEAEEDLGRSALWIDEQQPGLGKEFTREVRRRLAQLAQQPELGPERRRLRCRRLLVVRFKHGIFYRVHGEIVVDVSAIVDLRRAPHDIAHLLTDRP